jgi:NAD(P)H-dependent FMN reductase
VEDDKLVIAVISGSSREKRESIKAAKFVAAIGDRFKNLEIVFVDPKDFSFPNDGNDTEGKDPKYTEITARADGFFIVTPEYNHSFPGSLKRMLDSEYENYLHKPVALAGVSNSAWGGVRAVEGLLPALRTMGLSVLQTAVYFPRVQDIFDEQGDILPELEEKYTSSVVYEFEELIWMAKTLKWGRKNIPERGWE